MKAKLTVNGERPDYVDECDQVNRHLTATRSDSPRVLQIRPSQEDLQSKLDAYWESTGLRKAS